MTQHPSHDNRARAPNPFLMAMARAPWEWGAALAAWPMLRMAGMWPRPTHDTPHHVIVCPASLRVTVPLADCAAF